MYFRGSIPMSPDIITCEICLKGENRRKKSGPVAIGENVHLVLTGPLSFLGEDQNVSYLE